MVGKIPLEKIPTWASVMKEFHYKKDADRFAGGMIENGYHAAVKMYFVRDLRWYKVYYWPKGGYPK